jgi:hypothetical protein
LFYHCSNQIERLKASIQIRPESGINSSNADLLMIAGNRHCSFAIMDHVSKELVAFSYLTSAIDTDPYNNFFEEELFNQRFNRIAIAYDFNESVLIPWQVYDNEDIQIHLQAMYGSDIQNVVVAENIGELNLYNVYRLPAKLHKDLQVKFMNGNVWHFYTMILKSYTVKSPSSMLVDFKTDSFSVVVFKESKLVLTQTFSYTTPEDILYYLLKTCHQLDISQKQVMVTLSGLIEKDSAIYRELYKYFIHLEFEGLYGGVKVSEELKTHPEHYYSSISKLAACVS